MERLRRAGPLIETVVGLVLAFGGIALLPAGVLVIGGGIALVAHAATTWPGRRHPDDPKAQETAELRFQAWSVLAGAVFCAVGSSVIAWFAERPGSDCTGCRTATGWAGVTLLLLAGWGAAVFLVWLLVLARRRRSSSGDTPWSPRY